MTDAARVDVALAPGAPAGLDADALRRLVRFALPRLGVAGAPAVSILITDDAGIQRLHAAHLGLDEPTDILTYALDADAGFVSAEDEPLLGEIVISHETAAANAAAVGHSTEREIAFLVLHGLLHLTGYDDQTPAERAVMLARQEELLSAFEQAPHAAP